MGVWCGVCAERLSVATENYGSFQASEAFSGWPKAKPYARCIIIEDTCETCAKALSEAVAKAANVITSKYAARVTAHARQVEEWERERRERGEFERDFERQREQAWRERQEKK